MLMGGGLPAESVARYGAQIADAMAHAHQRGVIHRDLKSSNIVITPEGRAKVLDFGLAKLRSQGALDQATRTRMSLTEAGTVVGTLSYLAPEVLRGTPADERSDLWALGVVLYEMASGGLPFEGTTSFDLTSSILRDTPKLLPSQVTPGLRGVIQRCLAKEPGERYQQASEVRAALEALGSSSEVVIPSPPDSARKQVPRWAILGGMLLIAVAIIAGVSRWGRSNPEPASATKGEQRSGMQGPFVGKPSANAEANEYFQKGMLLMDSQFNIPRARQMFERALEIDPHFAKARAVYGFTYVLMIEGGHSNAPDMLYKAEEEERRAIRDDPGMGYSSMALAAVFMFQGRKDMALPELERAHQANPTSRSTQMWWLLYHRFNGNYEPAEALAKELLADNPTFFPPRTYWGEMLREQGKFREGIREQEKVLDQDPTNILALCHLSRAYVDLGDVTKARAALERLRPEDRQNFRVRLSLALVLAREGKKSEAHRVMDSEVEKYAGVHAFKTEDAAAFYAAVGERDKALDWLDRAVRSGDERAEYFQRDPLLASIREEPRFKQLLESIAFRRQQREAAKPASGN
jgi:tetratricopeptide (TPR) repeat protein